jgi:hypothetical protein
VTGTGSVRMCGCLDNGNVDTAGTTTSRSRPCRCQSGGSWRSRTSRWGVADVRAGRGYRPDYDTWTGEDDQWNYSRGRNWATLAPESLAVKRGGKINPDAVRFYFRHRDEIL